MRRLWRLVAICVAGAVVLAGGLTGVAVAGSRMWHSGASATDAALPPLDLVAQSGSVVYAADGKTVLAVLQASINRKPVTLAEVAPVLQHAVLDTEDHGFYVHGGIDVPADVRALVNDSSSGAGLQGGSTITEQLVKQTYLSSVRTISRKIKEAVLAVRLQQHYTKQQILQAYLNTIYLGNGAYGVEAAANEYFGSHASQVTLPEAALLAGLIQDPNGYDPILNPAAARVRRSQVLARMQYYGDITKAQEAAANAAPLPTAIVAPQSKVASIGGGDYVAQVEAQLLGAGSPLGSTYAQRYKALFEGGLKIYTNLDPAMQADATQAVAAETPSNSEQIEEAMVAIDPANGDVRALVGGPPGQKFDAATQATRQPGSGFKLFTLLAALKQGYSPYDTVLGNSPCAIAFPGDNAYVLHPAHNDTTTEGGVQSIVQATANSVNCAYIRLGHEVGLPNIISMAHALGVSEKIPQVPSIIIGSAAVKPIEMADAYAAVADGGVYHAPSFINKVVDSTGATIYTGRSPGKRVVSTQVAAEAEVALRAVVQQGTGISAALYNRPAAGKTGTTENFDDAWFNGFVPQLAASVWMGAFSGEKSMYLNGSPVYGADYPAATWHRFMSQALSSAPVESLLTPDPGLIPPTKFVTSPSLVAADHSDHNAPYSGSAGFASSGSGSSGSGSGSSGSGSSGSGSATGAGSGSAGSAGSGSTGSGSSGSGSGSAGSGSGSTGAGSSGSGSGSPGSGSGSSGSGSAGSGSGSTGSGSTPGGSGNGG